MKCLYLSGFMLTARCKKIARVLIDLSVFLVFSGINCQTAVGQSNTDIEDYNRSSISRFSLLHPNTRFSTEIETTLGIIGNPDRYNDHTLNMSILYDNKKLSKRKALKKINNFLIQEQVAKQLVAKWFNRAYDGSFDLELVMERGNYNASFEDVEQARQSIRGMAILQDAGEQLIGNTFVLVNDITYVDKEERAQIVRTIFQVIGAVAQVVADVATIASGGQSSQTSDIANLTKQTANMAGAISDLIAGFRVKIKSYLYRLVWDEQTAHTFYEKYYFDSANPNPEKKIAFENDKITFKLQYIGTYKAKSSKTVIRGLRNNEEVFRKVLTRAIDENIVKLQKQHPVFKVTTTVHKVDGRQVWAKIGLKEGVKTGQKYEVLERVIDDQGRISYRRRGVIKPIARKIWDNRCYAFQEGSDYAGLDHTTFKIVSGGNFYPGMLIREKGKKENDDKFEIVGQPSIKPGTELKVKGCRLDVFKTSDDKQFKNRRNRGKTIVHDSIPEQPTLITDIHNVTPVDNHLKTPDTHKVTSVDKHSRTTDSDNNYRPDQRHRPDEFVQPVATKGLHSGFRSIFETGITTHFGGLDVFDYNTAPGVNAALSMGYQFGPHFYLGLGVQLLYQQRVWITDYDDVQIYVNQPVSFAYLHTRFDLSKTNVALFIDLKGHATLSGNTKFNLGTDVSLGLRMRRFEFSAGYYLYGITYTDYANYNKRTHNYDEVTARFGGLKFAIGLNLGKACRKYK